MCNLFSNTMPVDAMRNLFGVDAGNDHLGNQPPLPAIFPRYEAPVMRQSGDGQRELVRMHRGFLMPQVSKKTGKPILPKAVNNARDDKVRSSSFWRSSFAERRCLVPATSFCEAKGKAPATYYWFGVQGDDERPPFAFAGMWRQFRGNYRDELVEIDTFTILTTKPNDLVRKIHPDRMPVILDPADHATWLDGSGDEAYRLVRPFPEDQMRIVQSGEDLKSDDGPT
ncbi:SOS response-associated peptidase [Algicella marina]|uniref:Abasic site processing protein n=2 Tax=Algicella marina TaxID=2683284 RepID=A0A6P1T6C0_9RHOB|nr:SOS response-associated peptidase [Algicella marina]